MAFADGTKFISACLIYTTEQLFLIAVADQFFEILRDDRREVFNRPRIHGFKDGEVRAEEDYRPNHDFCPSAIPNAAIEIGQKLAASVVQ